MWLTGARQWLPPRLKQGVFCFSCTGVKNPDGANSRNARVRNYYDYISRKSLPTLSISHSLFSSLFLPSGPVGLREHVQPFYLSSSDALFLAHSGARFYPLTFRPFCCTPYLKPWNGHSRVYSVTRIAGRILPHKLPTHSDGELKKKKLVPCALEALNDFSNRHSPRKSEKSWGNGAFHSQLNPHPLRPRNPPTLGHGTKGKPANPKLTRNQFLSFVKMIMRREQFFFLFFLLTTKQLARCR